MTVTENQDDHLSSRIELSPPFHLTRLRPHCRFFATRAAEVAGHGRGLQLLIGERHFPDLGDNAVATFYRSDIIIFTDGFESGNASAWSATVGLP